MKLILEILLMGFAMLIGSYVTPGVTVDGLGTAIIAAVLIALANGTLGLVLRFFTLPLNLVTLGLFSFIITVLMIRLVDSWMIGFSTSSFWSAAILAIAIALVKMLLDAIFG